MNLVGSGQKASHITNVTEAVDERESWAEIYYLPFFGKGVENGPIMTCRTFDVILMLPRDTWYVMMFGLI